MKTTFLLLSLVSAYMAALQPHTLVCDPEKGQTDPGNWITYADQNTRGLTPAEPAADRKVIACIHRIFRDNYQPIGVTVSHSAEHNANSSEMVAWHPNRYGHPYNYHLMNFKSVQGFRKGD